MGWEQRRGRRYYYLKRREGKRVISEYIGAGRGAELLAARKALAHQRRAEERAKEAESAHLENLLDDLQALTEALMQATLLVEGYHLHRGEWRKKRHGQREETFRSRKQRSGRERSTPRKDRRRRSAYRSRSKD